MKNEQNFFGVELIVLFLSAFPCGRRIAFKRTMYDAILSMVTKGRYPVFFENYSLPSEIEAGIDSALAVGALVDLGKGAFRVTSLNTLKLAEVRKKMTVGHALLLEDFIRDVKRFEHE